MLHDGEGRHGDDLNVSCWPAGLKDNPDVAFTYNDGILQNTQLCILKNAPNLSTAIQFVNAAVSPDLQANLPLYIDYGPGNPAAFKTGKIATKRAKRNCRFARRECLGRRASRCVME